MSEKIPEGWEKVKLGEVAEIKKEIWNIGNQNLPYIGLEHIQEDKLRLNSIGNSTNVSSNKYFFTENEFLFGKLRPYFRKLYKPTFKGVCSTDIWVVKAKDNIDKNFLFYLFASKKFIDLATTSSSGTRMPRADWDFMSKTEWLVPSSEIEQKAIAGVLSSLDDKIDLLHRQNKTLEQMAQTLFRKWFIEDVKEDWEEYKIGEKLKVLLGGTPSTKKPEYWNGNIPWINSGKINKFRILEPTKYITQLGLDNSSTKLLPKGTTVLAITGATLGQVSRLEIDACANQSVIGIIGNEEFSNEYIYLWIKHYIKDIISNQTGGAQQHINRNDVKNATIIKPDKVTYDKFMNLIKPLFDKISKNSFQIRTLEKLRDTLLPKLMSGEIKIKNME